MTKLTTPVARPDITHQVIRRVRFEVPHRLNATNDDIIFDKDSITIWYTVETYNSILERLDEKNESAQWNNLPAVFKDELKAVYDRLVTDAKNKGLILPGTDEDLTAP